MSDVETWWRIHDWKMEIEPVEVVKATEYFVTYRYKDWRGATLETRQQRAGKFFQTWEEARAFMEDKCEKKIKYSEDRLRVDRANLDQIKALKRPA